MYTTERWYPNQNGGGSVQNGTVAATGLLFVPPGVKDNAPVVVWAHPTLGQEDKCSISRGTESIPSTNGATGQTTMGPGGMDINLTDVVFFLDQMLQKGYVVVMPDYLGIAVDSLDINQNLKTYAVGPQEARDVYYAAQALQDDAKNGRGWPGLSQAGQRFIVAGHSQGGHAALWTGASERKDFAQNTGMNLKGVISIAPATDLNKLVDVSWDNQANWVIGPEIIQTWVGYLPQFALQNNTLSNAVDPFGPNPNVLAEYESDPSYHAGVRGQLQVLPRRTDQRGHPIHEGPERAREPAGVLQLGADLQLPDPGHRSGPDELLPQGHAHAVDLGHRRPGGAVTSQRRDAGELLRLGG